MSDKYDLLQLIEKGICEHGGDLGGWTFLSDESLKLFDGRVTLHVDFQNAGAGEGKGATHSHVLTTLHDFEEEVLDACIMGIGSDRNAALAEIAMIWITCVAGPIKSFLENKPVCMSCQSGVIGGDRSQGYAESDYGLTGLRAFVGPSISRFIESDQIKGKIDDSKPWFRFAAESAAPRRVHLVKSIIQARGKDGWTRQMEVDGHDVSYFEPNWPAGIAAPQVGYLIRYAVFEFPANSTTITRRFKLDEAIRYFAKQYNKGSGLDHIDRLKNEMIHQGFDPQDVQEIETISTIAFSRAFFEATGIQYSHTIIRAREDGRIEPDIPLMSIPAFTRARALSVELRESMSKEDFQSLCFYNAESGIILQVAEAHTNIDFSTLSIHPCIVPDRNVSQETMDAALALLKSRIEQNQKAKKKPWWKFW